MLYIGSSIGNFEPEEAERLLASVRATLDPGDCLLLGVDLVKQESVLLAAYDDAAGVTAAFNRNLLVRLNRELDADFNLGGFCSPGDMECDGIPHGDAPCEPQEADRMAAGELICA